MSGVKAESVVTDSAGLFELRRLPQGDYEILVRRIGFVPASFAVTFRADTSVAVEVPLEVAPSIVDSVLITGERAAFEARLHLVGFTERRVATEQTASWATFITPEEIQRRQATRLSQLLEGRRGVRIGYGGNGLVSRAFSHDNCPLTIWLNGQMLRAESGAPTRGATSFGGARVAANPAYTRGLDEVQAESIIAVEVYPTAVSVPMEFQTSLSQCGAIILWTK